MNDKDINEAKQLIKTHFQKSEWKVCKLKPAQLAELISSVSNGIKINAFGLERLLKDMGYRHHQSTGQYMMRLSDRLTEFAREKGYFTKK